MTNQRELLILRHAKSAWDTDARTDFDRPLAKRGKRDAPRMGTWMHSQGLVPDLVLSSPAKRAKQTTLQVCSALGLDPNRIRWDDRIYAAPADLLLAVLADVPESYRRVLLVGHNPGLEDLIVHLAGTDLALPDDGKLLPTASLARLAMPPDWRHLTPGVAQLLDMTRARSLSDGGTAP